MRNQFWDVAYLPDRAGAGPLLPSLLEQTTNSDEFAFCRLALQVAVEERLSEEERWLLTEHFWEGQSKTQLAHQLGVVPSTVSKRLGRILELLGEQVAYGLRVYRAGKKGELF